MHEKYPIACVFVITALAWPHYCRASDRPTMTGPPAGQEAAKELVDSAASACNRKDFIGFMEHFTPKQKSALRRKMEDLFIKHELVMEIQDVVLLSEGEETIVFAVRYAWSPKTAPKQLLASRVMARKVDGEWKLDGEQVRSRSGSMPSKTNYADSRQFPFGGGGEVEMAWNPLDPPAHLIDPSLESLRGDIGIQPGRGCANGRCGVR
jgi:hypothetical protein